MIFIELDFGIEGSDDTVKAEADPKIKVLREKTAELNEHIDGAAKASESDWESVKFSSQKSLKLLPARRSGKSDSTIGCVVPFGRLSAG